MNKIYDQFANVYDQMGADRHSLRMCDYTLEIFRKFKITPKAGFEVCCGTGTALKFFVDRGYSMCGLDQSRAMLKQAQKKVGRSALLVRAVLPDFRVPDPWRHPRPRQFDFAISYFDSLNYLLSVRDLCRTFKQVHTHLETGGWFIFDMNTPRALEVIWGDQTTAGALDDLAWIFRNSYDSANTLATARVTFFRKEGKRWRRFDETHVERGYPNEHLRKMLNSAGFSVKAIYKCFSFDKATRKTNRICVVARRR